MYLTGTKVRKIFVFSKYCGNFFTKKGGRGTFPCLKPIIVKQILSQSYTEPHGSVFL